MHFGIGSYDHRDDNMKGVRKMTGRRVPLPQKNNTQTQNKLFEHKGQRPGELSSDVIKADCFNHGYRVVKTLGEGAYAKVKLADVMASKLARNEAIADIAGDRAELQVAIKVINKQMVPKEFLRKFLPREIKNHSMLPPHKHVCRVFDHFSTQEHVYLVKEYCSQGDLLDLINRHIGENQKGIGEEPSRKIFKQLCLAIQHVHTHGMSHRDIKCENVLLDDNKDCKLTDFGFSCAFDEKAALLKTSCGSCAYTAPEVIQNKLYNGHRSDIWSLGIILFAMANGRLPFNDAQLSEMEEEMKMQRLRFERSVSFDCMVLIRKLLMYNPQQRPAIAEVIEDSWLTGKKPIPRQLNKPKWISPYQAKKKDGDEAADLVVEAQAASPINSHRTTSAKTTRTITGTVTLNHKAGETVTLKSRGRGNVFQKMAHPPLRPNTWPRKTRGSPVAPTPPPKPKPAAPPKPKGPDVRKIAQLLLEKTLKQGDTPLVNNKEICKQVPLWLVQKILESESENKTDRSDCITTMKIDTHDKAPIEAHQIPVQEQEQKSFKPESTCCPACKSTEKKSREQSPSRNVTSPTRLYLSGKSPETTKSYTTTKHLSPYSPRRTKVASANTMTPRKQPPKSTRTVPTAKKPLSSRSPVMMKKVEPEIPQRPAASKSADQKNSPKVYEQTPAKRASSCRERLMELYGYRYSLQNGQVPLPPLMGKTCVFEDKSARSRKCHYSPVSSRAAYATTTDFTEPLTGCHSMDSVNMEPVKTPKQRIVIHCP